MDYGHPLSFGAFITPTNVQPHVPVGLAQLTEELGYDLITFQDHPYQPRFLDVWTLLSYVAAATTRIHVAPNVLNLPMRDPLVAARAAASIDLLSDGRFAMGLGAGAFWDAIAAMGRRRLSPGRAVDALDEAIDLMRGLWRPEDRTPLHGGEFYPVAGAARGPAPAHAIPIWLGAYKPRMLRLTGRKGDGWLPGLPHLRRASIGDDHARIDDSAADAGRDPRDIRRLLNVLGGEPAELLAELAVEHGFSTFIVATDDVDVLTRFAGEIAPEVRRRVADERSADHNTVLHPEPQINTEEQ
ncbi:LLM class flavin-dependent oxidoreductase [Nonomuraea purpurea]|uniref:LLM class flavin-dependent oxidoreductase n=1 Tax=Nonomuraea purpurea TaxID=1849276 RepID=A0ABV8GFG4_9ACTN